MPLSHPWAYHFKEDIEHKINLLYPYEPIQNHGQYHLNK